MARLAVPFVVLDAAIGLVTAFGSTAPQGRSLLGAVPALLTLAFAALLARRWFASWCLVAAHGLLLIFSWLYVTLFPFRPESRAVTQLYESAPVVHGILTVLRVWYLPLVGVIYLVVFTRPQMRAFLDPADRCGVSRFDRPHVD